MNKILAIVVLGSVLCVLQQKVHGQSATECYSDGGCLVLISTPDNNDDNLARETCCRDFQVNSFKNEGGEACLQCNPEDRPATTTATTELATTETSTTEVSTTKATTTTQQEVLPSTTQQSISDQQDSTEGATTAGALGRMVYKGSYFIVFFLGVAAFILGH